MNARNPKYPSLREATIRAVPPRTEVTRLNAKAEQSKKFRNRVLAGVGATALLLGPGKGLIESDNSAAPVKADDPRAITETIGGPNAQTGIYGDPVEGQLESTGDGYREAIERAGERDEDNDGVPNKDDPDVDMYSADQAAKATGYPADQLPGGALAVVGEVKEQSQD